MTVTVIEKRSEEKLEFAGSSDTKKIENIKIPINADFPIYDFNSSAYECLENEIKSVILDHKYYLRVYFYHVFPQLSQNSKKRDSKRIWFW